MAAEPGTRPLNGEWAVYSIYGLTLASDFPFASYLAPGAGAPDLTFTCVPSAPLPGGWEDAGPDYASPPDAGGESSILLYRLDTCLVLRSDIADFYLWPDRIICHLPSPEHRYFIEILLLGVVLSCWLEWRGVPALHASAIVVGGGAAAFLAPPGRGKSSIAGTLMQAGHPLLTDDVLAIERSDGAYVGHPGYPQVRVWPDRAQHLLGHYENLDLVYPGYSKRRVPVGEDNFGTFCDTPQPLACLYLPERRDPSDWGKQIQITPVPPREGLMALIGHSFVVGIVETLGLHAHRFGFFSQMVSRVPVRRVVYPNGSDHLPRVRQAILEDLTDLWPPVLPEAADD